MSDTRSSLLRRVRDPADEASWREFKDLYEPLLFRFVRCRGLAEAEARDVVQEVFLALVRALPRFELDRERGRFRSWLWQVTGNAIADWARRQRRQTAAEEEWRKRLEALFSQEPDADWHTAHRQRVLDFALARVRAESQSNTWACFEQHLLQGRPGAAVAAALGLSVGAVYMNASRVLARVRDRCADYLEELGEA